MRFCREKIRGDRSISAAIAYISDPAKTENGKYIRAINCSPKNTWASMELTNQLHRDKRGKREYKHFIQSFAPGEKVNPDTVLELGEKVASFFDGYQMLVACHTNSRCLHYHVVISARHPQTKKKVDISPKKLLKFWRYSINVYQEMEELPQTVSGEKMKKWLSFLKGTLGSTVEEEVYEFNEDEFLYPDTDWLTTYEEALTTAAIECDSNQSECTDWELEDIPLIIPIEYLEGDTTIRPIEYVNTPLIKVIDYIR